MRKGFASLIILSILVLILAGAGAYYFVKTSPTKPQNIIQRQSPAPSPTPDETANWKTYTNKNLGFEFQYPPGWIENDICEANPFCLYITEYATIPYKKDYIPQGMGAEINTKEEFLSYKANLDSGRLPGGYLSAWNFIKVGGKNAIQLYDYNVPGGKYQIVTRVITNKALLELIVNLPVEPIYKNSNTKEYEEIDVEKSKAKVGDIKNQMIDRNSQDIIEEYNQILSTFQFTN